MWLAGVARVPDSAHRLAYLNPLSCTHGNAPPPEVAEQDPHGAAVEEDVVPGEVFAIRVRRGEIPESVHRPEHHRRFMILSLVPFINPALGRLVLRMGIMPPMVTIPVQLVVIVTLLVRARWRKTLARPYAIGLVVYLAALAGLTADPVQSAFMHRRPVLGA
jgi:hypothetical protein